jgi:hypothetical protein
MEETVTKTEIREDYLYFRKGIKEARTISQLQNIKHRMDKVFMSHFGYKPEEGVLKEEYTRTANAINKRADSLGLAYKVKTKIWGMVGLKPLR